MLDRRRFETLVFTYLAEHLRTGDVAITGSDTFANWLDQLPDWEECGPKLAQLCEETGLPDTAAGFTGALRQLSEAQGLPLAVAVSGANLHDSQAFKPLILGIPSVRSRRGPRRRKPLKVRADKAYYSAEHLRWLRSRNLIARIARPGIESGERLGRHRWKIERSISWLFGYRRLTVRYERKGSHFLAFLGLAAALTCYKRLAKLAT